MTPAKRSAAIAAAIAIAVPAEGLRQVAYYDPPGIPTVCFGHTGKDVEQGRKYSLEECHALLDADMQAAFRTVERCHPGLPAPVLAAFSDAVYNIGPSVACASTASDYLKLQNYTAACEQLLRWHYTTIAGVKVSLPGLVKRRAQERDLCLTYKDLT